MPKAFVVARAAMSLDGDQLMDFVAGQVAPHKKIRQVEFVDEIPKSPSGQDPAPRPARPRARLSDPRAQVRARRSALPCGVAC